MYTFLVLFFNGRVLLICGEYVCSLSKCIKLYDNIRIFVIQIWIYSLLSIIKKFYGIL